MSHHENPNYEEYLEALLRLASENHDPLCPKTSLEDFNEVRPSELAELMGVSRPSVTAALTRMEAAGHIYRERKKVFFTPQGFDMAHAVLKRHRVAEEFLVKVLGFTEGSVHDEACELEHSISERMLEALEKLIEEHEEK